MCCFHIRHMVDAAGVYTRADCTHDFIMLSPTYTRPYPHTSLHTHHQEEAQAARARAAADPTLQPQQSQPRPAEPPTAAPKGWAPPAAPPAVPTLKEVMAIEEQQAARQAANASQVRTGVYQQNTITHGRVHVFSHDCKGCTYSV